MSNAFNWTPSRNQDISFEDGLALIDAFYEGPTRDALPGTASITPQVAVATQTVGHAQATDDARAATAVSQLTYPPVDRHATNKGPILPSSPPQQNNPQWQQPQWNYELPPSFTSPPSIPHAPLPSPAASLATTKQSVLFPVASHIKSGPSPQLSRATQPNAFSRDNSSPTMTNSKAGSSSLATSKNTSPDLSTTPKIDSPILTTTPAPVKPPPPIRKTPIPLPKLPVDTTTVQTQSSPITSAGTRSPSVSKETKTPSSKALKKAATDSPGSASAPRSVKKQRCVRCVKQHGACDLDTKHPCTRCSKANVAPEECVPREYNKRRPSQPAVGAAKAQENSE